MGILRAKGSRGASLIEAMMAAALLAGSALTVYPVVFQSKGIVRQSDFHDICINAVRAKLNEYRYGTVVDMNATPTLTADTGVSSSGPGQALTTGFSYAKVQYNSDRLYCPVSAGVLFRPVNTNDVMLKRATTPLAYLGRQECFVGAGCPGGVCADPPVCAGPVDTQMQQSVPGLKIFVNLRRFNSTLLAPATTPGQMGTAEDCAWFGASNAYDFQQAGDMIKVTVTGLIDLIGPPVTSYNGISAGDLRSTQLVCQISDYIRPFNLTARYWLQDNGHIYRWAGVGASSYEVFKTVTATSTANALAFAVSPDNTYLFLLQAGGILIRYGTAAIPCGGEPLDCTGPITGQWQVPPNMYTMTAMFGPYDPGPGAGAGKGYDHLPNPVCGKVQNGGANPIIFGLLAGDIPVCLDTNEQPGSIPPAAPDPPLTPIYDGGTGVVTGTANTRIPFLVPATGRINSIFMDNRGLSTFVVDKSCSTVLNDTTYCCGIYSSYDLTMQYPLDVCSVRSVAFSK